MKSHTLALSAVLIATLAVATPLEQFGVTINTPNTQLLERGLATRTKLTDVLVRKDAEDVSLKADKEDSSSNDEVASQSTTLERRLVDNFLYFLGDTVGVVERGAEKIIGNALNGWWWIWCTPGYNCPNVCRPGYNCVRVYQIPQAYRNNYQSAQANRERRSAK